LKSEGDLEARDGGQQVQASVESALVPSMINEEQVQVGVDVVETTIANVVRIEVDLAKIILNVVEQETIYSAPMLEHENANEVVHINQSDILNFTYYN
jgi:HJR/Mrr/RecB family endonuclease